uniref:TSA: Wollemia nobilis Ref_Wollemi_Transcript_3657_1439 transcribed RNA sequence n=1 Tax=Wollemia nobilis TaxID=56998 RepID=A0A0C9RYK1_9CONI
MAVVKSAPEDCFAERRGYDRGKAEMVPKMVCVTSGTSYVGLCIVMHLLRRGYAVRVAVDNGDELQKLREMEEFATWSDRAVGVVTNILAEDAAALSEVFEGCYGVFHTSSFIDPHGLSGFTEQMVRLEVEGAEKVVEACSLTCSVRRLVFTSSLGACIWQNQETGSAFVVDEKCWSDPLVCRENKLWFALSKTIAEKTAWTRAEQRDVNMVTLCPALLTGRAFSSSNSTSSIAYLKGANKMLEKGVLATVDVRRAAEAHVCVYEAMGLGASGRYVCFDKIINNPTEALDLENSTNMKIGFSQLFDNNNEKGGVEGVSNAKLARLTALTLHAHSCRE